MHVFSGLRKTGLKIKPTQFDALVQKKLAKRTTIQPTPDGENGGDNNQGDGDGTDKFPESQLSLKGLYMLLAVAF